MTEVKIPQLECVRCGHKWIARKATIKKCPQCKSIYWDVPKDQKRLVSVKKGSKRYMPLNSVKQEKSKVT